MKIFSFLNSSGYLYITLYKLRKYPTREGMQFQLCELFASSSPSFSYLIIREATGPSSSNRAFAGSCYAADAQRFGRSR